MDHRGVHLFDASPDIEINLLIINITPVAPNVQHLNSPKKCISKFGKSKPDLYLTVFYTKPVIR